MPRIQKCGICNQEGHNRRSCPNKDNKLLQLNKNEIENDTWNINDIEYVDSRNDERNIDTQQVKIKNRKKELEIENEKKYIKKIELDLKDKYKVKILTEELEKEKGKMLEIWLNKNHNELWFNTQVECGVNIGHYLMEENRYIALAVAEPGVGKTNLIQYLIYHFKATLNSDKMIIGNRITIATGMSSKDWIDQTEKGTSLLDKNTNEEIYHRDTLHRRIEHLKDNPELLSDHVFILDECHIGCDKEQTIDNLLNKNLKLTKEIIKKLKIKFILISATPDIILAELEKKYKDEWKFEKLEAGIGYRGFGFIKNKGWLYDYDNLKINEEEIFKEYLNKYSKPKYHIIRVRGKVSEKFKKMIINLCATEHIGICKEHNQKDKIEKFEDKLKEEPDKHTFVFIKEFYRASKRLRLTKNIGMIIEPSVNNDVTVVGQNLIARFFGYYDDCELEFTEPPMFICNEKCVEIYLKFVNTFNYGDINYESRRMKKNGIRGNHKSYQDNYTKDNEDNVNDINITDVVIEEFSIFEDLKKRSMELFNGSGPKEKELKNGFYLNSIAEISFKIMSEEEVKNGAGRGLNPKNPYRYHVCYTDINNKETIKHLLAYKKYLI